MKEAEGATKLYEGREVRFLNDRMCPAYARHASRHVIATRRGLNLRRVRRPFAPYHPPLLRRTHEILLINIYFQLLFILSWKMHTKYVTDPRLCLSLLPCQQVLRDVFGHEGFRLSQEAVIKRLLVDNENALVLYPTGGMPDSRRSTSRGLTDVDFIRREESDLSSAGTLLGGETRLSYLFAALNLRAGFDSCDLSPLSPDERSSRRALRPWCQSSKFG